MNNLMFCHPLRPLTLCFCLLAIFAACKKEEMTPPPPSILTPQFTSNTTSIKAHESVQFTDQSTFSGSATVTASWQFEGGTPATSSAKNPQIKYEKAGQYTVTLTVSAGGMTETITRTQYITVAPPDPKIAMSSGLPSNIKGRLEGNPNNVRFVRYDPKGDGTDVHIVARNGGGWNAQAWTAMVTQLNAHGSTLEGATYIGRDGSWLVVYSNNGYASNGLSAEAIQGLQWAHSTGSRIIRFDVDSEGGYAIRTATGWKTYTYTSLGAELSGSVGFAFGSDKKWAVVYPHDYALSSNCPQSLKDKLASLKSEGVEFLDIEIGDTAWVIVYR